MQHHAPRRGGRRFRIHSADPRAHARDRIARGRGARRFLNREEALTRLRVALDTARQQSLAAGTRVTNRSQWAYWEEFCRLFDVDVENFGTLNGGERLASLDTVRSEEDTLAAFIAFVISSPRQGTTCNTANYALQCISTVRSYYALSCGRRPGLRDGNKTGGHLRAAIKGFQKTHPSRRQERLPILQQHLRAIKTQLDIQNNRFHKVLWALWLTQWQGVLRSSDLIKRAREANRPWRPSLDTHRGRLSVDRATDLNGKFLGVRLKLQLKPNKTDQAGVKRTVKTFVIDERSEALSAGQAIREMLKSDINDEGQEMTPLFRNPDTGKEITYEESNAALSRCLAAAGFTEPAGTHSLRIGGATAYANATAGGYAVSGFMGLWASDSKHWYMHACAPRVDMAALEIGRAPDWELAERPGPVARYAT